MPSSKVKLDICGSTYMISTNDSPEHLTELAARLDEDMKKVMQASNSSVVAAAVITALGYLDEETKTRFAADNMRAQIQDYLEDAATARLAAEEARRELERLRRELSYYEKKAKPEAPKRKEPLLNVPPPVQTPQKPIIPEEKPVAQASKNAQPLLAPEGATAMPLPRPPKDENNIPGQLGIDDYRKG